MTILTIFRSGRPLERWLPSASRHGRRSRLLNAALAVALLATVVAPLTAQAQTGEPSAAFDDIAGNTHQSHIERLHQLGILDGTQCAERLFCPGAPILRSTFAVWLVRVADGEDPAQTPSGRFQDVEPDHPWITHIERLAELKITLGCNPDGTLFCPDVPVSRAQMASFLDRAFDLDDAGAAGFEDVNPDSVHAASIDAIHAAEITIGCTANPLNYCPRNPTTRAQMATFLSRAITHQEDTDTDEGTGTGAGTGTGTGAHRHRTGTGTPGRRTPDATPDTDATDHRRRRPPPTTPPPRHRTGSGR